MKAHKITMTATLTVPVNPKHYPGYDTDEERLACDLENFSDSPGELLENENCQVSLTGEIIENPNSL